MKLLHQDVSNKVNYCASETKQNSSCGYKCSTKTDTEIQIKSDYGKSGDLNQLISLKKLYKRCVILMFANVFLFCFIMSYGYYQNSNHALIYSKQILIDSYLRILEKQILLSKETETTIHQESLFKAIIEQCNEAAVNKSKEVLNDFIGEWKTLQENVERNFSGDKNLVFKHYANLIHQINKSQFNETMQHTIKDVSHELQDNFMPNESYSTRFNYTDDNDQISDEVEDDENTTNFAVPINNVSIYGDARLISEESSHSRRPKRSNRRGKEPERRPSNGGGVRQRKKKQLRAPEAIHFKGGQPEIFVRDGGSLVAPWFYNDATSSNFTLKTVQLKQGKGAVEVSEDALYLIYSQVYYLTSNDINSYTLNLKHGTQPNSTVLAYCSAVAPNGSLSEISCYTSVVQFLKAEDRIFIQQRDMNRRIILRDGYSFLGIVRLSG